ncbi:methionyl-tRNA formyltransferase [Erythrobacter sp. GH1-10]|uniref:methionyl-tRNA formyltransferase n=1 Tax=Erythrobacter sp. GH1-10 TaxID=3349334 RepID=UPI003877CE29
MRAAVVGAVGSTAILLEELANSDQWDVPIVVTLPQELYRRHSDLVELSPFAERLGSRLFRTGKTNDPGTLQAIDEAQPDYVFVVGWSQLCSADFLAIRPGKVIGYHPAPLPRLRGRAALPWTILLDERITAGSLFWMGEGTDDGDLLAQHYFHLAGDETVAELYDRHMRCLSRMLQEVLPSLAAGDETRTRQDERCATWAAKRTPADGLIDWHDDTRSIDRLIRAVGRPYPGAYSFVGKRKITIWRSEIVTQPSRYHAKAGQIVEREEGTLRIATKDGLLALTDWEIEGEKPPLLHSILRSERATD